VWYLASLAILGYFKEALMLRTKVFPLFKVTRNPDTCTLCRKCDKVCPMAIKVSESGAVNHIDCHMCGDCIEHCPEKDVLKINRRKLRWLPPLAVIVLTAAAIWFASFTEIPTISERWGTPEQMENAQTFEMSGLKNIKCFGSSMSFAEQMKNVSGVLGVETYVGTKTVKIFYDPAVLSEEQIKQAIFTPVKLFINDPECKAKIGIMQVEILNYFDAYDEYYLTNLFTANPSIYAFSTSFGEPVNAVIYYNPEKLKMQDIIKIIESPELIMKEGDTETITPLNFKTGNSHSSDSLITRVEFYNIMLPPIDDKFNRYETYAQEDLSVFEIPVLPFGKTEGENLIYLESHASGDDGVVGMKSYFRNDTAFIQMTYAKSKTNPEKIFQRLTAKKFTIYYSDGTSEDVNNVYDFTVNGKVIIQ